MNIEQLEDFLVLHCEEVGPETEVVVRMQVADGSAVTIPVVGVEIRDGQLVIAAVPRPNAT